MKKIKLCSVLVAACCALQGLAQAPVDFQPVAVIELFTSEGCSSCPPADKLLAETVRNADGANQKIFAIAFHVDYWNRLGWKDTFSTRQYTDRQGAYVESMHLNGTYTPQMVVNGTQEFVGSNKTALNEALDKALSKKSITQFGALKAVLSGGKVRITYALNGDFTHSQINFALVSLYQSTAVKSGENGGRVLEHTNVVRKFVSVTAAASGNIQMDNIPSGAKDSWMLIAYVQQNNSLNIIGAAGVKPLVE